MIPARAWSAAGSVAGLSEISQKRQQNSPGYCGHNGRVYQTLKTESYAETNAEARWFRKILKPLDATQKTDII